MLARGTKDKEHAMLQKLNSEIAVIGVDIGKNSLRLKRPGGTIGTLVENVECPITGAKQLHQPILRGWRTRIF